MQETDNRRKKCFEELVAGPIKLYYAPQGTSEPLPPTGSPPSPWQLIGDTENYSGDGLAISMSEETNEIDLLNELLPVEEFITSQRTTFEINIKDMRLELLGILLGNTVASTAASGNDAGYRRVSLERSFRKPKWAFLAVGLAPYEDTAEMEGLNYYAPRVTFKGPGSMTHMLSTPIEQTLTVNVLKHKTLGGGYVTAAYELAPSS